MSIEERKISVISKSIALNPNAEEFVPSSLRSVNDSSKRSYATTVVSGISKESSTDKPESILRSNSDEEAHQYWQQQLPDDITPDFKVMGQDESPGPDSLSLTDLSINDGIGTSIFSPNQTLSMQHRASPFIRDKLNTHPKINLSIPTYMDERSQATILSPTAGSMSPNAAPWVKTLRNGGHYNTSIRDASQYNGDSSIGASLHNLTDAYHGSRRSLSSTMDIMNQLESKVDGRRSQNLRSLSFGNSSPTSPASYAQNGLGNYAGREHVSLDVPRGRYKTTSLPVPGLGSSRGYQLLGGSYNGNHDMISTNTPQNMAGIQTGPAWLESDAEASTYLESKDEVHDFASLRHAVLEQELYSIQSLLAQEKARETTYRQRLQTPQLQGLIQEQNPPIDLCGLHISEAIHVLNYELNNRRKIVRSTGRRLQVMIISSARTPARLTAAVEQYLMEHGLLYTQVQPGLLRILL
ncbi:uncharacterized protein [Zea mays]|uniref:CTC-interacting domain 7 n=2 Tax=Zea mays TaxID=4577 RepID=C0P4D7_MAIZE|nr:uncharacterized protein LOC100276788 isoform X2 [Zea mays]XP_035818082.1 uncharacterized protein LOC100276788 isoform X2 [Zea mays]XP_035818083.1 uncharacterized protein LOC100276788 isoform X2 [Zea mays]ACN27853.1 unknown [Zea mays]AQL09274.1 CTC-interacting domain 7 [Zea mays]AQL09275.1 CTC-interacting domain 7 [Zea mays]|eukprot:XP_020399185.1 uncharacterized protein LOC100276788 isoform X2 [Zea mays]